jgi:hypothetical protein
MLPIDATHRRLWKYSDLEFNSYCDTGRCKMFAGRSVD